MTQSRPVKTREQVLAEFQARGISVAEWAREHGFNRNMVREILKGEPRRQCFRGKSHQVAVLLGLKQGVLNAKPSDLNAVPLPRQARSAQGARS